VAEIVNNLGRKGTVISCYNDVLDEDCAIELLAVDFWLLKPLPLYRISEQKALRSLEKLNFYSPKKL